MNIWCDVCKQVIGLEDTDNGDFYCPHCLTNYSLDEVLEKIEIATLARILKESDAKEIPY